LIFKEGLILNTQTLEFGTTKISPLYRYAPNKKDLSAKEKSLVVNLKGANSETLLGSIFDLATKLAAQEEQNV